MCKGYGRDSCVHTICVSLSVLCAAIVIIFGLNACSRSSTDLVQGYVEGEFVYVSSPLAGTLETLSVRSGERVEIGDLLFNLEDVAETAAGDEAERRLAQARANLDDIRKGKRPSEIDSIEAQLKQARAALVFSEKDLERQEKLIRIKGATSEQDYDRARAIRDQSIYRVAQLEADLSTAKLGSRTDQIAAAVENVRALEAALSKAEWEIDQKSRTSPQAGLVFDTIYYPGEWVAAGHPVVVLLPPQNIKVRAFVSQTRISTIQLGESVQITVDGIREPIAGKVSFISPQAEFTPPVIYSRESRSKLVFMIEASFDPQVAVNLHPGQPVDVQFGS